MTVDTDIKFGLKKKKKRKLFSGENSVQTSPDRSNPSVIKADTEEIQEEISQHSDDPKYEARADVAPVTLADKLRRTGKMIT